MSTSKPSILFGNFILQMLPVMFGVFLGLWASNWNEDRKQEKIQKKVLQKMKQDFESNHNQIFGVVEYHKSLGDSARHILNSGDEKILGMTVFEAGRDNPYYIWGGTRTSPLRDGGYQTAVLTGVLADLDFELVALLSEINQAQLNYNLLSNKYLETVINMKSDVRIIDQILFATFFSNDMNYANQKLIRLYEVAFSKFSKMNL